MNFTLKVNFDKDRSQIKTRAQVRPLHTDLKLFAQFVSSLSVYNLR